MQYMYKESMLDRKQQFCGHLILKITIKASD